ncbi:hypothetical protein C1645_826261 [Glomus cerebriforme]|uniref:Uncharacterized protein n=1 Tax=Glomus cerebriforme TaxID=658196 RepID=A0A397SQW5_9GLOM|nr:hypothetical protein C1645_826261 [Glomus cerebriforme]
MRTANSKFLLAGPDLSPLFGPYDPLKLSLHTLSSHSEINFEAMRNEYVVAILHTAINITENSTGKKFRMRPEYEVIGNESM